MANAETMKRQAVLAELRGRLARIELARIETEPGTALAGLSLGPALDAWLPAGGLVRGGVHEMLPATLEAAPAVAGFSALILTRLDPAAGPILWLARAGAARLYGHGLAWLGLDPGRVVLVTPGSTVDLLWAAEEALRCSGVGAVVMEIPRLGLTPARRLALAAEAGGTLGVLLRQEEGASACRSRWRIGSVTGGKGQDWQPRLTVALDRGTGCAPRSAVAVAWQGPGTGFVSPSLSSAGLDRLAWVI